MSYDEREMIAEEQGVDLWDVYEMDKKLVFSGYKYLETMLDLDVPESNIYI